MSSSKKSPPPIVYIAGILAVSAVAYAVVSNSNRPGISPPQIATNGSENDRDRPHSPAKLAFEPPTTVPAGSVLKIGGSTSMAHINQGLKIGFEQKFPGVRAFPSATSSSNGLTDLATGTIDLTGISRSLTTAEKSQGTVLAMQLLHRWQISQQCDLWRSI